MGKTQKKSWKEPTLERLNELRNKVQKAYKLRTGEELIITKSKGSYSYVDLRADIFEVTKKDLSEGTLLKFFLNNDNRVYQRITISTIERYIEEIEKVREEDLTSKIKENTDLKKLWAKSGNRCAICRCLLFFKMGNITINKGDECHIVSKNIDGPRYQKDYPYDIDDYKNLILLCKNHHNEINRSSAYYNVERLLKIKEDHENWIEQIALHSEFKGQSLSGLASFSQIIVPDEGNINADMFYDGYPPSLMDLKAEFDFPRNIYHKTNGIKAKIKEILTTNKPNTYFIIIKGVGGSGKSTLIKRIGFDLAVEGRMVFHLNSDWIEIRNVGNLQTQLKNIADACEEFVIIIDNIVDCVIRDEINFQALIEYFAKKKVLFVLADQPDRLNIIRNKLRILIDLSVVFQYDLHQLDNIECDLLADKMIALEQSNKLSIRHLNLTKDQRVELCKNISKRHFVVAMLQIRYGKNFSEIIIEEFEKVPSKDAKNAYLLVCFCVKLGFNIPETSLLRAINLTDTLDYDNLKLFTEGLILHGKFGLSTRHPIIAREIYRNYVTSKNHNYLLLKSMFSSMGDDSSEICDFLFAFLGITNINKVLFNILEKDKNLLENFIEIVYQYKKFFTKEILLQFLTFHASIERRLGENNKALEIYKGIINNIDKEYAYAYRQIAWIEHEMQNYTEAAKYAIKSYH